MAKYVMIFDKEKCIGCNACVVSCQQNYNMPPENKLNWVTVEESGEFPNLKLEFTPHQCAHCDDPKCIDVCPAEDATFKTKEGYVLINAENCIGCKACIDACP
jgi:Fe-S-cluster-containing dehydrogenase component